MPLEKFKDIPVFVSQTDIKKDAVRVETPKRSKANKTTTRTASPSSPAKLLKVPNINSGKQKNSLTISADGTRRHSKVTIPAYLKNGQPGMVENTRFKTIEEPVRRRVNTASTSKKSGNNSMSIVTV